MRKLKQLAAIPVIAAALAAAGTAQAQSAESGFWSGLQIKLLATGVIPSGAISRVKSDPLNLTAGANTSLNNNVVPTLAVEYFFNPDLSVETICCFTSHHVTGTGTLADAGLIDHVLLLPATLTLKYHLDLPYGIRPYVGAGPAMFFIFDTRPGSAARALGVTSAHLSDNVGGVVQAGFDVPINHHGLSLSFDAKKYWVHTNADFYAGSADVLSTNHRIDPWVISSGFAYRF